MGNSLVTTNQYGILHQRSPWHRKFCSELAFVSIFMLFCILATVRGCFELTACTLWTSILVHIHVACALCTCAFPSMYGKMKCSYCNQTYNIWLDESRDMNKLSPIQQSSPAIQSSNPVQWLDTTLFAWVQVSCLVHGLHGVWCGWYVIILLVMGWEGSAQLICILSNTLSGCVTQNP